MMPVDERLADAAALMRLIKGRHSCRAYVPQQVPMSTIKEILGIAQGAASWCNSQPWQVIVTSGEATNRFRDALLAHATSLHWADQRENPARSDIPFPARYTGIYRDRQRSTGWALYESVGIAFGDRVASAQQMLENFRLFGAPHVMIVTTEADLGTYGAIDCGGWIANVLLAAQSLGVATIAQAAVAGVADFVREWFDIPGHRHIVCGISFGYADADHTANGFRTGRAALDEVVSFVS